MHKIGNNKWDENTTLGMGENICKQSKWKEINLQNIQGAHAAQYEKKKTQTIQWKNWQKI